MKYLLKATFILFAMNLLGKNLSAQGSYATLNIGYGFKMSSKEAYNVSRWNNSSTYEIVRFSLGKGKNVGCALGYMFNKTLGVEMGVSYFIGDKLETKHTDSGSIETYCVSAIRMLRINPTFVLCTDIKKINPYAKFGFIIGSGSFVDEWNFNYSGDVTNIKFKYKGGFAFGVNASIGAIFNLADKKSVFIEVNTINMSYAPAKAEMIENTENGVDKLPTLSVKEKEWEFVDKYTTTNNEPASQPLKRPKTYQPFGSLGLNIGFRIQISK